jgi:hypothetical protein
MPLFAPPSDGATAVCIGASTEGIEVEFSLPSKRPIDFEVPPKLSCVTLNTPDRNDVMVKVKVALGDGRPSVECDMVRSFLYVLAIERSAAVTPAYSRPDPEAHSWKSTIVIPWSVLRVRGHSSRLNVTVFANGARAPIAAHAIDLTIEDRSGALSLVSAPIWKSVPPSSTRRPRLHEIGTDAFFDYDQNVMAATTTGNNDAESTVSRALSEVLSGALIPLPAGRISTAGPESLVARTETLLAFLKPSDALGDPNLRFFADSEPFRLTRVGSLASGYTLGYLSDIVKTGAFYGLKQGGQFDEAYGLTIATPSVAATPAPLGVDPPPSLAPLATVDLLHSVVANGTYTDYLSGLALGSNFYRDVCASEHPYCAIALHFFASTQRDENPRVTSPTTLKPPYASDMQFAGESGSYTTIVSPDGATPTFVQAAETIGFQQPDRFYSPTGGKLQALSALGGVVGHVTLSYGTGSLEHLSSVDVLGVRLTTPYGDVFTDLSEQFAVPFDVGATRGWSFDLGAQTETLSDRVAEMQQGLVQNYFAAVYPTSAALKASVTSAIVRPQSQQNAALRSPVLGFKDLGDLNLQLDAGYQQGFVTNCRPLPASRCMTGKADAATWAFFANRKTLGFGVSSMPSMSIPEDVAIARTARYFGSYGNSPGSVTTYLTFTNCVQATVAYTNVADPIGVALPQKGSTVSGKVYYPFRELGVEVGYSNTIDAVSSASSQLGFYVLLRFTANLTKVAAPGCPP